MQYISCPSVWADVENGFGVENRFFIGDLISINLFEFVRSDGWKVRNTLFSLYQFKVVRRCPMLHNL